MVVINIEERITMKDISGNASELGMPIVKGRVAKTAAAKPLGNIIVIKFLIDLLKSGFTVASLITTILIPRNAKVRIKPKNTDEKDEKANNIPVKTKKKERIKKLI